MQLFCMSCRNPYEGQRYITFGEEGGGGRKKGRRTNNSLQETTQDYREQYRTVQRDTL